MGGCPTAHVWDSTGQAPWARPVGEGALLLRFGTEIDETVNTRVLDYMATLDLAPRPAGVRDVLPAYASLMVHFDPLRLTAAEVEHWCCEAAATETASGGAAAESRLVCWQLEWGWNLCGWNPTPSAAAVGAAGGRYCIV